MAKFVDMYGEPAGPRTKEEFLTAMCGLASDVTACANIPEARERCVHYGCVCATWSDSERMYIDENGNEQNWTSIDSAIIDFITKAVSKAIKESCEGE